MSAFGNDEGKPGPIGEAFAVRGELTLGKRRQSRSMPSHVTSCVTVRHMCDGPY